MNQLFVDTVNESKYINPYRLTFGDIVSSIFRKRLALHQTKLTNILVIVYITNLQSGTVKCGDDG